MLIACLLSWAGNRSTKEVCTSANEIVDFSLSMATRDASAARLSMMAFTNELRIDMAFFVPSSFLLYFFSILLFVLEISAGRRMIRTDWRSDLIWAIHNPCWSSPRPVDRYAPVEKQVLGSMWLSTLFPEITLKALTATLVA